MGMIHIFERGGEDLREYKQAVKMAKEAIDTICELTEEMEDKFSSRGGYGERGAHYRDEYDRDGRYRDGGMSERSRDHRGRWI